MSDGACPTCGKHGALPEWARKFLNRRAEVEEEMIRTIKGQRPMPDVEQLRKWAKRLGVPDEYAGITK